MNKPNKTAKDQSQARTQRIHIFTQTLHGDGNYTNQSDIISHVNTDSAYTISYTITFNVLHQFALCYIRIFFFCVKKLFMMTTLSL